MHSAPSVTYPVGRSRNAERLLLALWALGVCSVTVACAQATWGLDWNRGVLLLSAVVAGAAAWTGVLSCSAPSVLRFDGLHWSVSGGFALGATRADVALDLQVLVLVCLKAPGRTKRWVWLDRSAMPDRWRDLRRALYSRPLGAGPAGQAPESTAARVHHSPP
jgi:hypothetical protein